MQHFCLPRCSTRHQWVASPASSQVQRDSLYIGCSLPIVPTVKWEATPHKPHKFHSQCSDETPAHRGWLAHTRVRVNWCSFMSNGAHIYCNCICILEPCMWNDDQLPTSVCNVIVDPHCVLYSVSVNTLYDCRRWLWTRVFWMLTLTLEMFWRKREFLIGEYCEY